MFKYARFLNILGIESSNAVRLTHALDQLHLEISSLDKKDREIFLAKTLNERMNEFAKTEDHFTLDEMTD